MKMRLSSDMNLRHIFSLALILSFGLSGCNKPEPVEEDRLSLDLTSLSFAASSASGQSVSLSSNCAWEASCEENWVTISPASGKGDAVLSISVEDNVAEPGKAAAARSARIVFKAGEASAEVQISQSAETIVFAVDGKAELTAAGGTVVVKVDYNSSYTVDIPVDWISRVDSKAVASETLNFAVAANESLDERSAVITFTPEGAAPLSVNISQEGAPQKGISTSEELLAFAKAWNAGDASAFDPDGDGIYFLGADIDMSGQEWIPIGMPTSTASLAYNSKESLPNPFTAVFDGRGHRISNLSLSVDIQSTQVCGLFGSLNGAIVRDLILDKASLTVRGSGISTSHVALGFIAGQVVSSTIENVNVQGNISGKATSVSSRNVAAGGICGLILSATGSSRLSSCRFSGSITLDIGEKYSNTNTAVIGGIAAAVSSGSSGIARIESCVNEATIDVKSHRAAGIVGNAYLVEIDNCINEGPVSCDYSENYVANVSGVRMGGILAYCSEQNVKGQKISSCVNNGLISTQEAGSVAGGVCGLIKCYDVSGCRNYGDVIAPEGMRGLLVGVLQSSTTQSSFSDCALRGRIGARADQSDAVQADSENYLSLGATIISGQACDSWNRDNVKFIGTLSGKGIATAEELLAFAKAWNAGESIERWQDGDFVVNLLGDIDCSSIAEWEPIGKATFTWASNAITVSGTPFTGHFDGNGFSLKKLNLSASPSEAGTAWGLFGAVTDGGIVENLRLDGSCSFDYTPTASSDFGAIAGLVCDACVRGIVNDASISAKAHSGNSRMTVASIGFAYAKSADTVLSNIKSNGTINVDGSGNTSNGATGTHVAGIAGFASIEQNSASRVYIRSCVSNSSVTASVARSSGIVAAANKGTVIEDCVNNGCNTNSFATTGGGRIGNISCITGSGSSLKGCINNGDLISTTSARAGGLVSLVNSADCKISDCENHGRIISDEASYRGTVFGYCNNDCGFNAVIARGDVGSYNDGNPQMTGLDAANYMQYIGKVGSNCSTATSQNIWWTAPEGYDPDDIPLPEMSGALPSMWTFTSSGTEPYTRYWTLEKHRCIPATDGTAGIIRAVRGESSAATPLSYSVSGGKPYVSNMVKDDYLLFSFPVSGLDKGTAIQFNLTLCPSANTHKYWLLEWCEGNEWKSNPEQLSTAPEDPELKYTARLYYNSSYQYSTVNSIIRLGSAVSDTLRIRMRAVGDKTCSGISESTGNSSASLFLPLFGFSAAYCNRLSMPESADRKRILCLGNSFSYYNAPVWKLQELAASQGHELEIQCNLKGSQTLQNHCSLVLSTEAVAKGGYDYAFIQDQSQNPALYQSDPVTNASVSSWCSTLSDNIRRSSPSCTVILENTWSYSGSSYGGYVSYDNFDSLLADGTASMARAAGDWISPIGQAFALCRSRYPEINLYHSDNKHQGAAGAYLKACVNYLVLFGGRFDSNAADCGLDSATAAKLRSVAEETVCGNESYYYIERQ